MSEVVKLQYPITVDGQEVTEIALRRPKVRDMLAVEKLEGSDGARELRLLANLAELPPETLEELDVADYQALQQVYAGFLS